MTAPDLRPRGRACVRQFDLDHYLAHFSPRRTVQISLLMDDDVRIPSRLADAPVALVEQQAAPDRPRKARWLRKMHFDFGWCPAP
jgi:hypothetical protein